MIPMEILNYRVLRQIGSGGMGEVYLAQNQSINQLVAIKSLHPQFANNQALRSRFKQEAMMLSSLNHPNIVKFLNYVENEYGVFLIMEYVDGCTLEDFINKKNGLIVEKRAYPMMCEILDAFSYAHNHGIVHRDIKPSNIFINKEGHIKVMDFGIAQIFSTIAGSEEPVMGTPSYMSPEQVMGRNVDQRSDIYSLGILFHQMLTGRAPYDATTLSELEIKRRVINEQLSKMKDYYPYVSDGLQKVVDKATNKLPEKRYASCEEMKRAVKQVIDPDPINKPLVYGGIALIVVAIGILFGVWDYYRTKVYYYKDYTERLGVPEGIYELSSREMSHSEHCYRMEYHKHKLRRMTLVNSQGKCIDHSDSELSNSRYSDVEYFYADNGNIDYKKIYDRYGKLLFKMDYDENLKTAMFKYDDEYGTAMRLQNNTTELYVNRENGTLERSRISRYLMTYDEETGLLQKILYAGGENNEKVGDKDNIYGQAYEYDEKGRIVTVKFLGNDEKVRGNKIGLAIKKYTYDDDDNWTSVAYYSADGNPAHDGNNCPLVTIGYDKWGNRSYERYSTLDGKPSLRTDIGTFGFKYEYDDHGFRTKTTAIDGSEKAMTCKYGWASATTKHDENGFETETRYLDIDGKPTNNCADGDAYAIVKMKPDEKGRVTEISNYDLNGSPTDLTAGYSRYTMEYDSVGNMTQIAYYDKEGKKARIQGYYCVMTRQYDAFNREIHSSYWDENGNLTDSGDGTCAYDVEYDSHGNIYRVINRGADGKTPARNNNGVAYIIYKYDEVGNNVLMEFCDERGNNCLNKEGIHKVEYVYEPKTNFLTETQVYGLSALSYTEHSKYDDNGNEVKSYTTNAANQLKAGTQVTHRQYDKNNRITKVWYTNLSGAMQEPAGMHYSVQTYQYDARGNVTKISFLKASGAAGADESGTAVRIHKFDDSNRVIYEKNLSPSGKPLSGANSNAEATVTYDERGNITTITTLDGYGKPGICAAGYHKVEMKYNNRNKTVSIVYTGIDGKLAVNRSSGFAKNESEYDSKGNCTLEKYYGANGRILYMERYAYNAHGMTTRITRCNAAGKEDDQEYGFSRYDILYQSNGVIPTERRFYNASGRCLAKQKYNAKTQDWGPFQPA